MKFQQREKDVFVFELSNDRNILVYVYLVWREGKGNDLNTDLLWPPMVGHTIALTLVMTVTHNRSLHYAVKPRWDYSITMSSRPSSIFTTPSYPHQAAQLSGVQSSITRSSFWRVVAYTYISEISLGLFLRMSASRLLSIASGFVSSLSLARRYPITSSLLGVMRIVASLPEIRLLISS